MFDIGWSELVVIAVVALIVIGPKELSGVLRGIGHWMGKIRRMASEFQGQFQDAMREAEVADLKKQVDDLGGTASDLASFNPMADAQKELDSAFDAAGKALEPPGPDDAAEAPPPQPEAPSPSRDADPAAGEMLPEKKAGSGA